MVNLGMVPLHLRRKVLSIKYWLHLSTSCYILPILWNCYTIHQQFNSTWLSNIRTILNQCGLSYMYEEGPSLHTEDVVHSVKDCLRYNSVEESYTKKCECLDILSLNLLVTIPISTSPPLNSNHQIQNKLPFVSD